MVSLKMCQKPQSVSTPCWAATIPYSGATRVFKKNFQCKFGLKNNISLKGQEKILSMNYKNYILDAY